MKIHNVPATVVVSERGAGWPADLGRQEPHLFAIPQERHEEPATLISRVTSTLGRLKLRGIDVGRAFLVCNRRLDEVAVVARVMIAEAMLTALCEARGGCLVLVANSALTPALEPHLRGLAHALCRGPRVEVACAFHPLIEVPRGVLHRARRAQVLH